MLNTKQKIGIVEYIFKSLDRKERRSLIQKLATLSYNSPETGIEPEDDETFEQLSLFWICDNCGEEGCVGDCEEEDDEDGIYHISSALRCPICGGTREECDEEWL